MNHLASVRDVDILVKGEGAETIVMVHGWPDTYRLWDAQVQFFMGRYRCVHFTLPGFDASSERRAYTLDELTTILKQVIEQVAPGQKVILMVHDWGCVFAYEFYMRNPQMVSRIIGVDVGDMTSMQKSWTLRDKMLVFGYQSWLGLGWVIGGRSGDWMSRFMARALRCPSPPAYIGSRMNYPYFMYWFGGRNAYRKVAQRFTPACPILFIYGRRKPVMFHAKTWTDGLLASKGNRVEEFDTSHWVMSDQADRFNRVVDAWLSA
jgi:cis-3-alkyl-4-acyloxetan-2-one decarboxylase